MLMTPTPTDAATVLNLLINLVIVVMLFLAKWELSRIESRVHRIENVFFNRGAKAIAGPRDEGE